MRNQVRLLGVLLEHVGGRQSHVIAGKWWEGAGPRDVAILRWWRLLDNPGEASGAKMGIHSWELTQGVMWCLGGHIRQKFWGRYVSVNKPRARVCFYDQSLSREFVFLLSRLVRDSCVTFQKKKKKMFRFLVKCPSSCQERESILRLFSCGSIQPQGLTFLGFIASDINRCISIEVQGEYCWKACSA